MRYITSLLLLLACSMGASAQTDSIPESYSTVYEIVQDMPRFPGCEDSADRKALRQCSEQQMMAFIHERIQYPDMAREEGISGTVVVRFIVSKTGRIRFGDQPILKDIGWGCGAQALAIVEDMPDWIPGRNDLGEKVDVMITLPIKYTLTENDSERAITIKWGGVEHPGVIRTDDLSRYAKGRITLAAARELLSRKKDKGIPIFIYYGDDSVGFSKYFVSLGKTGKKELITDELKHNAIKKKFLKHLEVGDTFYFYNWEYKRGVLEMEVVE